ncbi:MAG: tail fiber domain-containing protein [Ignavibacteriales bacterium]|nr:tail fiber domain-containing protein [Ignavibacteriales bacterium]
MFFIKWRKRTRYLWKTIGDKGRGVYGEATGTNGIGIYGIAPITGWAGYFVGNIKVTGSISTPSDIRLKKDIIPIKNALNSVRQLSGVTYNWKVEKFPERNFDNTNIQIGVIAQDVEKIFPQLVNTDQDGYKSVDYIKLSVVTMQAVKEQNEIIIAQESNIKELENRLSKIESLLAGKRFTSVSK